MVEFEKSGIPTVTLTAPGFEKDARGTAKAFGHKQLALTVLSSPLTNLSPEDVRKEIGIRLNDITEALTREVMLAEEKTPPKIFSFKGRDRYDAFEEMNTFFLNNGWSDGFPLIPPTREKVDKMLGGTSRSAKDVIAALEPGMGEATVEKIAINAVMAGCAPPHMPVLIAAVEAMAKPEANWRNVAVSTSPHTPIMIINGPIAKELNVNSGRGALGPGRQSAVNTVLGRAVRLIMMNIGHAYVGELDMDTIGSPNKYSMCIAENEEQSPWEAYHVERGFSKNASTVTIYGCESQIEIIDVRSYKPEHVLLTFAGSADSAGSASISAWLQGNRDWQNIMLICPEHAKILGDHGWSKKDVREFMYHNTHIEWKYLKYGGYLDPARITNAWKWLLDAPEDTKLPVVGAPEWFHIVVVGGPVGKSSYLTGNNEPVTIEIRK